MKSKILKNGLLLLSIIICTPTVWSNEEINTDEVGSIGAESDSIGKHSVVSDAEAKVGDIQSIKPENEKDKEKLNPKFSIAEIRIGNWFSEGSNTEQVFAPADITSAGTPLSQLDYTNLESDIINIGIKAELFKRYYVDFSIGSGSIDGGTLIDRDWFSAEFRDLIFGPSVDRSDFLFSDTTSRVDDGDYDTFNLELGRDLFTSKNKRWKLAAHIAYNSLEEKHIANGLISNGCDLPLFICDPAGTDIAALVGFEGQAVISNELEFDSWLFGLNSRWSLSPKFTLYAKVGVIIDSDLESRDTHHQRDDLKQDPSFLISTSADGYDAEIELDYAINQHWSAAIGYQKASRDFNRKDNVLSTFPVDEPALIDGGSSIDFERDGIRFTIKYKF